VAVIAFMATSFTASAQPMVTRTNALTWDNLNPWGITANFTMTAFTQGGVQVGNGTVVTNKIPFIVMMGNSANGSYFINGITTDTNGIASDPSTNFVFQWFGTIAIQNATAKFDRAQRPGRNVCSHDDWWRWNSRLPVGAERKHCARRDLGDVHHHERQANRQRNVYSGLPRTRLEQ
jgi:hypothetical protein